MPLRPLDAGGSLAVSGRIGAVAMQKRPRPPLDASRIASGLYQGGVPPHADAVRRGGFDTLVLCAAEIQPPAELMGRLEALHCPLDDDPTVAVSDSDWTKAVNTAERVARRVRGGRRVLVTCAQGRNRSGLVSCITLHLLTGMRGSECIGHIKRMRGSSACTNPQFNRVVARRLR